ncbi:MAG: hypothetical protein ACLR9T_00560 [Thomasclavelia sp.]|uniref:hypothetical protein n=1 Tax=Thomasclavelia sp. TaxID=3025757 RepID=UPI00399FA96E
MKLKNNKIIFNETEYIISLFLLSLMHPIFGLIMYICLLKLIKKYGVIGAIKYMIIVTMRSALSTAVGVSLLSLSNIKLIIFILLSLYIILKTYSRKLTKSNLICIFCSVFCVYTIIASFITGSYPITSTFKVLSFGLVFCSVIMGIDFTKDKIDWLDYLVKCMTPFFIVSIFLIPFSQFRLINENFQGVFNQVNMFSILAALYIPLLLNKKLVFRNFNVNIVLIIITISMQYLTASRTGLFVSIIIIIVNFVLKKHTIFIYFTIGCICFFSYLVYSSNSYIKITVDEELKEYIYKGDTTDILFSRREMQKMQEEKYNNNKLIGSGFMMPYISNYSSLGLEMSLNVEPGNLIWCLRGDVGIIGTIVFVLFLVSILLFGNFKYLSLLISSIGVCMGEMVFFSVNSIGILLYVLIAIYLVSCTSNKKRRRLK